MGTPMDPRIEQTIELMGRQLHRELRVSELASAAGLSIAQFARLFRQATGMTPVAYLHQLRLARARILLERTNLSVSEIMAQVGISDRSHFGRDFRSRFGASPRTLRMHLRNGGCGRIAG